MNELATKYVLQAEVAALRADLTAQMERLERRVVMWTSSMVLASAALAFAAGRIV